MNAAQQDEYIVQALRMQGAMYEDDARKFLADHDDRVRATALAEAKVEVVAWLVKKAAEGWDIKGLASKVDRGAVRIFLGTGHYWDAMDAHRAKVLAEAMRLIDEHPHPGDNPARFYSELLAGLLPTGEEATATAATATPEDFFVAGRTYTRTGPHGVHLRFVCEHLTTDPKVGDREAWGWLHRSDGTRRMQRMWDHDYPTWTPEAGDL